MISFIFVPTWSLVGRFGPREVWHMINHEACGDRIRGCSVFTQSLKDAICRVGRPARPTVERKRRPNTAHTTPSVPDGELLRNLRHYNALCTHFLIPSVVNHCHAVSLTVYPFLFYGNFFWESWRLRMTNVSSEFRFPFTLNNVGFIRHF